MGMMKEFRDFAVKGNVADMAVGIIIGGAFGGIVKSLVDDILMPPLGLVIGGVDFKGLKLELPQVIEGLPAVTVNYGSFIQTVVNFTIIAFALFLLVKGMNKVRSKAEAAPAAPAADVVLLTEIRDLLKAK
jgi:large conductance mechanosensitive channel